MSIALKPIDELTLATQAARGDSSCAMELRGRVLRCAISVARKMRWHEALDSRELEDDVPNEVMLRLIGRMRQGFEGEPGQFRSYLYRVVTSVTADAVRRNLDRRAEMSLDAPFESADGATGTLRDFVENSARLGKMDGFEEGPEEAVLTQEKHRELHQALDGLDPWCRSLMEEAVVRKRPHAEIADERDVSVQMLDVSLKRCTERLYRNILMAYVEGPDRVRRNEVASAAQSLPEDLRDVFIAWWTRNQSVKTIAQEMGLASDETKRRLARAKATMWTLMS